MTMRHVIHVVRVLVIAFRFCFKLKYQLKWAAGETAMYPLFAGTDQSEQSPAHVDLDFEQSFNGD